MRKPRLSKETIETNRMLNQQYELLLKTYTDNAILFHDMHNHLQTIYHMAEAAQNREIQDYVAKISSPARNISNILWTGVGIVDAIINEKIREAERKGFSLLVDAELPSNTGITPEDFCTILTNLLDNAIESMERQFPSEAQPTDLSIRLSLRRIHHFLMIQVVNPCQKQLQPKKGLFSSLKPDSFRHGWGLKSVRKTVTKYNGNFSCSNSDGYFTAIAMLFFPF